MNIDVELEQISKAANMLDYYADSMQKLALNKLIVVAQKIESCYERGGTGFRAHHALKAMTKQSKDLQDRAVVLNRAVAIYKGEDEKQTSKGKQTVSTIENGYDVNWTKRPTVSKIVASVAAVSGSIAVSTAIAIGARLKEAMSSGIEIIPVTPAEDRSAVVPVNTKIDAELEKEAQEIADSLKPKRVVGKEPGSVFYSNLDEKNGKKPYYNLCTYNSNAMVIETVADPEAIKKIVKKANCSDFREYCVKKGYSAPTNPCKKIQELGCKTRVIKIGGNSNKSAESKIQEALKNSSSGVGYFYFGQGDADNGHAVMVYLDDNDNVMINDPGEIANLGKNKTFSDRCNFWTEKGCTLNDLVIVERKE